MSINDEIRAIVREEVRAAVREALADLGGLRATEPEPDLAKLGEVKRWVQVSRSTLKRWIADGRLQQHGEGRLTRVKLADVRAALRGEQPVSQQKAEPGAGSPDARRILASISGGRG